MNEGAVFTAQKPTYQLFAGEFSTVICQRNVVMLLILHLFEETTNQTASAEGCAARLGRVTGPLSGDWNSEHVSTRKRGRRSRKKNP